MKKLSIALLTLLLVVVLGACGNSVGTIKGDTASAKNSDKSSNNKKQNNTKEVKKKDIWTYYNNATWSNDYKGLKTKVEKVVVSNKAPAIADDGKNITKSAVGVKFKIENTTKGKFTIYPDQATIVTSTGEQVEADMIGSEHIGGEIDEGVIKEGDVIFYLERGNADKITWVKLKWSTHEGAEDNLDSSTKDYEIKINLK